MTKGAAFNIVTLLFVVASLTIVVYGARERQKQVDFLCTASGSLALVLQQAADQIQTSFDNGTYAKLKAKGIVSDANIAQAEKTRDQYRAQVVRLTTAKSPCYSTFDPQIRRSVKP
jgi:hypothetical protein